MSRPSQAADDDLLGTPNTKTTSIIFYLDGLPSEAETINGCHDIICQQSASNT